MLSDFSQFLNLVDKIRKNRYQSFTSWYQDNLILCLYCHIVCKHVSVLTFTFSLNLQAVADVWLQMLCISGRYYLAVVDVIYSISGRHYLLR